MSFEIFGCLGDMLFDVPMNVIPIGQGGALWRASRWTRGDPSCLVKKTPSICVDERSKISFYMFSLLILEYKICKT